MQKTSDTDLSSIFKLQEEILVKNGYPADATGIIVCLRCEKIVVSDKQGCLGCSCFSEAEGIPQSPLNRLNINNPESREPLDKIDRRIKRKRKLQDWFY